MVSIRLLNASSCARPPEALLQPALALTSAVPFAGGVLSGFAVCAAEEFHDMQPMVSDRLLNACRCVRPPEEMLPSALLLTSGVHMSAIAANGHIRLPPLRGVDK